MRDDVPSPHDSLNAGAVRRVGDTIRRPRHAGSSVVEALLVHLAAAGFEGAPRFLGVDDDGRQVLRFVEGDVDPAPPWQHDDDRNADALGRLSGLLRSLHDATAGFVPPEGATPRRPLPTVGSTWTHGDVGYGNVVYRDGVPAVLIDWEFAAPADRLHDPAALLATAVRGPRPDADDPIRRERATRLALDGIAVGYGCDGAQRARLPDLAAAVLDDAAVFWADLGRPADVVDRARWRADWFRAHAAVLVAG